MSMKNTKPLSDFKNLTEMERKVLSDMFGENIPVSSKKNGEALAKAILADMESANEIEA